MLFDQPVRQIAYYALDIRAAAEAHSRIFGSGPFLVFDNVDGNQDFYRGKQVEFDFACALGQWGDVMVEIWSQKNDAPSFIHELYPYGTKRTGLHHVALIVDDVEAARAEFEAAGYPVAFKTIVSPETTVYFMDTLALNGHFVELYERKGPIAGVYDMVRDASVGFDGTNPVRDIKDLPGL